MDKYSVPANSDEKTERLMPKRPRRDLRKPWMWAALGIILGSILVQLILGALF